MSRLRATLVVSILAVSMVCRAAPSGAEVSDQVLATRTLGPRWREVSRAAGMIFSGTVLGVEAQKAGKQNPLPVVIITLRVDRAVAGVKAGQRLTIREWAGAWNLHRPLIAGEKTFLVLYPPSQLGLTSPIGGSLGMVALDGRGGVAAQVRHQKDAPDSVATGTILQLERAIRSARGN